MILMILNKDEQSIYNSKFIIPLKTLPSGTYFVRDFFGSDPSVPRIARKFYEDVVSGIYGLIAISNA